MCACCEVYELIEECDFHDIAIAKLKKWFVKTPHVIFSPLLLATRKQKPGESLEEFLQILHVFSKDCKFRNVSAEEYQLNLVQDAFVNDLASCHIHPRLLKSNELTENKEFNKAMSLDHAEEYSTTYTSKNDLITASVAQDKSDGRNLTPSTDLRATVFTGRKKGYFVDLPIIESFSSGFPLGQRGILLVSAIQKAWNSTRTQRGK